MPCPAIVSESLWEAAERQLQTNKDHSPRNTRRTYLLRGMLRCALCGYHYYGRASGPTRQYYYCGGKNNRETYRANYTGELCPSKHLRAEHLEARVWSYIKEQITDEEKLIATFELRGAGLEEEIRRDQGELESLYAAEGRLASERNKMLDLYTQDLITRDVLQERLAGIQKRAESLTETKAEVLRASTGARSPRPLQRRSESIAGWYERAWPRPPPTLARLIIAANCWRCLRLSW